MSQYNKQNALYLAKLLGNPCVSPNFRFLSEEIEHLFDKYLYRIKTLHSICDQVNEYNPDQFDSNHISPYSLMIILYIINPRQTMNVFMMSFCSYDSADKIIKDNSRLLGINIDDSIVTDEIDHKQEVTLEHG